MFETMLYIVAVVAILGFFGDRHTTEENPTPATEQTVTTEPTEPVTAEPATELTTAEPTAEPATPPADLSSLSVAELRRRATLARYPWRNAHGRNRHSSKAELITALMA